MNSGTWKNFERCCAEVVNGARYPANVGGRVDVEGPRALAQCKYRKSLSHQALTDLAAEMAEAGERAGKLGCVLHGVPPGRGRTNPGLITMTWAMFDAWFSMREAEHDDTE